MAETYCTTRFGGKGNALGHAELGVWQRNGTLGRVALNAKKVDGSASGGQRAFGPDS
jgi:hypothetical protein